MKADEIKIKFIHNVIQKSLELGIAGICYHRNLFPASFFYHGNNNDNNSSSISDKQSSDNNNRIINFSKKIIFYQPTQQQKPCTNNDDDDEETKNMNRYLSEARYLLQWLHNGISVLKEGLLSRVIL